MQTYPLEATARATVGRKTNRKIRMGGLVPAIVYGPALKEPQSITIDRATFVRLYKLAGESSIVELKVGANSVIPTLIQDLQVDPMRGEVTHVDFRAIDMTKPVEAKVKLIATGESPAVKIGGTLVHTLESVLVRALPKDLPHELVVDISRLVGFEDSIKIKDIAVPAGVTILANADQTAVNVMAPRTEEEMAALNQAVDVDVTKVEVVEKKKAAEEGEGVEGAEPAKGGAPAAGKADAKPAAKPAAKK